ncbi:tetratricopeptide repeat protein [Nonomuraea sp. B12E4]|uniref:tetratricopeptide repeat protein n=1 Tax=Nonomuraea sp. B12E4 TaxID=3153564 RepID=UPI00325D554E
MVVTSRARLSSLVAIEGAQSIPLDLLSETEAGDLLARRLGAQRTAAEPEAVNDLIAMCAGLPLALVIVTAAAHRLFPLADLVHQLHQARDNLDAFVGDASVTDVRAVFSWSYQALSTEAARLFRLLALHPGPDIGMATAASLAALTPARIRPLLTELSSAHLISEHAPGRYAFHDLLRLYAAELADSVDPPLSRGAARERLLDHYLHTAHVAALLLQPTRKPLALDPLTPGVAPEQPPGYEQAMAWFATERPSLLATLSHAADVDLNRHAWQLAWTLNDFLDRQGHWLDNLTAHQVALRAAVQRGDSIGRAHTHCGLARAYIKLNRLDEAHEHLLRALDEYTEQRDLLGQADTTRTLAWVVWSQGSHREGIDRARRTMDLYAEAGNTVGQARALNNLGWFYAELGEHDQALDHCQQALRLQQEIGDRRAEAATWDSLGYIHLQTGSAQQAIAGYEQAVNLLRDFDDRHEEARGLIGLGDSHHAAGQVGAAREAWQQALDILTELGHEDIGEVRRRIYDLDR